MKHAHGAPKHDSTLFPPIKSPIKLKRALLALEVVLATLIIIAICSMPPQNSETFAAQAQALESDTESVGTSEIVEIPDQVSLDSECSHLWVPVTTPIKHPQKVRSVNHDAVYGSETVLHTVCNECHEVIDGKASSHIEESGHSGYTTSVPIEEKSLVRDAWTETVIDEEAWTENLVTGYTCSKCHAATEIKA